jgi:hypothetical protein
MILAGLGLTEKPDPNHIMVFFGEIDRASSSFGGGRLAPPVARRAGVNSILARKLSWRFLPHVLTRHLPVDGVRGWRRSWRRSWREKDMESKSWAAPSPDSDSVHGRSSYPAPRGCCAREWAGRYECSGRRQMGARRSSNSARTTRTGGWWRVLHWLWKELCRFGAGLRSERPYFTCSGPDRGCCCSQGYGRRSRECLRRSSCCGRPSRILEIRGVASCWELLVPPWHFSDLAVGRSMRVCLGGSASTFEIERIKSPTTFELVPTPRKRAFLLFRYGVHGDSIWGCSQAGPAPQCATGAKGSNKRATFLDR